MREIWAFSWTKISIKLPDISYHAPEQNLKGTVYIDEDPNQTQAEGNLL